MPKPRDYYDILGVSRSATVEEIRKAYRRLARKHHPDVNKSPDAAERFKEATEAYDVLCDPEKRKVYDQFGHAGVGVGQPGFDPGSFRTHFGGFGAPQGHAGPRGAGFGPDLGSIFEEMFGPRAASPFATPHAPPRPPKGRDLEHRLTVTFITAATGGTERLRFSNPSGAGTQTVDVRIPPGIEPGTRLRVKGKGQPAPSAGPPGDLIITVDVGAHPIFRRDGLDLLVDVPITLAEAGLGVTVPVPLLAGSADLKIPPGASSGQKLRIKGKGIRDASGRHGDFYAVVKITAPSHLSDSARQLLRDLAPELKNPRKSGPWADLSGRETGS